MENMENSAAELTPGETLPAEIVYPPKYTKGVEQNNIWLRSLVSLAFYLMLGYYIFHSWKMLLLITAIVAFHEMGHFMAMKAFRYRDLGIFFIPLLGAYVSGTKRDVSQRESSIILLAGPLPGIIIGIILYLLYLQNPFLELAGISYYTVSIALILLNLINLIPVYPLDGGQLLNRVFLDEESVLSKIFVFASIGFLVWFAIFGMDNAYPLLIFPAMMVYRMFGDNKLHHIEKKIQDTGINLDMAYEDLPDEDYWKIRNILIAEYPPFKDIPTSPPYEYCEKEEKVHAMISGLMQRNLIQDMGWSGKLVVALVWIAAIASPWLLHLNVLRHFGL